MSVSVSGCVSVCTPDITCVRASQPSEGREVGKGVKEEPGRSDAMLGDGACSQLVCVQYVCGVVFSIAFMLTEGLSDTSVSLSDCCSDDAE